MSKCPGCLKELKSQQPQFCAQCRKLLFDGVKVLPILPFSLTDIPHRFEQGPAETIKRISISGVQFKISLLLNDKQLEMSGQRGPLEFILKPPPRSFDIKHWETVPANEHLTMQLARQVFKLNVAANAYVQLADGLTGAYLTRRFDVLPTEKLQQEDFAQIDNRSRATHGENFKYETSHEHIAGLIRRFATAVPVALDEFFRLTLRSSTTWFSTATPTSRTSPSTAGPVASTASRPPTTYSIRPCTCRMATAWPWTCAPTTTRRPASRPTPTWPTMISWNLANASAYPPPA